MQWLFLAELVYQGSNLGQTDPAHDKTQWWDLCVLRIIAPIRPMDPVDTPEAIKIEVLWEDESTTGTASDDPRETNDFHHPSFPRDDCPLIPIEMAAKKANVDQVVRLFGKFSVC